ncbi:MAG: peptidase M1 [Crocinitomicaceae bacterium]|nr:peptidase M1 [Crocinitomicaceae bacterium]
MLRSIHIAITFVFSVILSTSIQAQYPGWQQEADYTMTVDMDVEKHQYKGSMSVMYTNNSPDNLDKIFLHAFFNAFQPGSMMDVRSRNIEDPDRRVGSRIFELTANEVGWIKPSTLTMNGMPCQVEVDGTIIVAKLPAPLRAGVTCKFILDWTAQVPRQIRRSGWMNKEGVEFSMTQWFPKICEYDHHGWHSNPYIGREFHGIWGDFDVTINLPTGYEVGGTGVLQTSRKTAKKTGKWHFKAENVIDFAWAADTEFVVRTEFVDGIEMNFIYKPNKEYNKQWKELPRFATQSMAFFNEFIGKYPYPQYTVIQGGDGGMEYPMITLITANRKLPSLVGVTVHEMAHSWFQALVATNESLYEWMDEGFTSWIESECMAILPSFNLDGGDESDAAPDGLHDWAYSRYKRIVESGKEEPLITHADHYTTNSAYGVAAYSKGEVFVEQLEAIIGDSLRDAGMRKYFADWSFKHPGPNDFKRTMERISDIELDWYFQYFMNTTHTIDYAVKDVKVDIMKSTITLEKIGHMPMPQDLLIKFEDGSSLKYHIPLVIMRGHRPLDGDEQIAEDWPWTNPTYQITFPSMGKKLSKVELDPNRIQADINLKNNTFDFSK